MGGRRRLLAAAAALVLPLAACSGGVDLPEPPPVPTGPTSTPTRPSPDPSIEIGGPTPTHVVPTPTAYPGIDLTGKQACATLSEDNRARFGLGAPDPDDSGDGFCPFPRVGATSNEPFDTAVSLNPGMTVADWAEGTGEYSRWTPISTDGVTGVMADVGIACDGIFLLTADTTLGVYVNYDDTDDT